MNTAVAIKRKSPRKSWDHSQPIKEVDLSDSKLSELKSRKELHEEWAAFRAEHQETIENHLSEEDYAWLEREIPQAVKLIGLRTPAELWERGKGSSRLLLAEIKNNNKNISKAKEGVKITTNKINSLEKKLKNIASPTKIGKLRGQERSGDEKKRKKAQKKLKQIKKEQAKRKGEIDHMKKERHFFQNLLDKLTKRNKKLIRFLRISSKKTRARLLTTTTQKWPAEPTETHLLEEEYAWFEREKPQATEPIDFSLWKRVKIKELEIKISIITEEIRPLRKTILKAIDAPESRKEVNIEDFKSYAESQRKSYLKNVNSERERINAKITRANIEIIRKKINKLYSLLAERREYRKRLEKLKIKKEDPERKRRTEARLLTAQEEKDVIFW